MDSSEVVKYLSKGRRRLGASSGISNEVAYDSAIKEVYKIITEGATPDELKNGMRQYIEKPRRKQKTAASRPMGFGDFPLD